VSAGAAKQAVISSEKHIHGALFSADQMERVESAETESFEKLGFGTREK
jgi:hypothetical protein